MSRIAPLSLPPSSTNSLASLLASLPLTKAAVVIVILALGCASAPPQRMGTVTTLSAASTANYERCPHNVPREVCAQCNPALIPKFKAADDWCPMHDVPESQCWKCHPDLNFDPLPPRPANADMTELSHAGEDVPSLESHAVRGKVTLFDFYAVWCGPCRKLDAHVFALLGQRTDVAVRKLNVVSWETPLAERYMRNVPNLPYVIVYGKSGARLRAISGLDLEALDRAIEEASRS